MIDRTSSMMYHIDNLNTQYGKVSYQMASGKVIDKGSDDAMLHATLIDIDDKIRVTDGLKFQINKTQSLNETADSNMAELKVSLDGIKVDLLKALNAGTDRSDKLSLAANLKGIRDNMYDGINQSINGEYIFAGSVTTNQTLNKASDFDVTGKIDFGGDAFLRKVAVQPGSYRDRGITALDAIYYDASKARSGEAFTFKAGERIIDESGHEWKFNHNRTTIQQYDPNGKLVEPAVEYDLNIPADDSVTVDLGYEDKKSYHIDLGVDANTDASGNYQITINGKSYSYHAAGEPASKIYDNLKEQLKNDGYVITDLHDDDQFEINSLESMDVTVSDTDANYNISKDITEKAGDYTVTLDGTDYTVATAGKTTQEVYDDLKDAIENDGYTVEALKNGDQFVITNGGADIAISVSDTDKNYSLWATNEDEATADATALQGSYSLTLPTNPEGRVLMAKHSYFDDLNVIINSLEGHGTKLDGRKSVEVNDVVVNNIIRDGLENTSNQFDATNVGHGKLGGRNAVFDVAYDKLTTQATQYDILMQKWGGADLAKLSMESKALELTYQALYTTIGKMNELSLLNYIK